MEKKIFVLHQHFAKTLHFDLRLEMGGTLKSWAVPKGAPRTIGTKHLAIATENHPLAYADFEGEIPEGQYGAGKVKIWDRGSFVNVKTASLSKCLKEGVLEFDLEGKKLKGRYALVHFKENHWLWIKVRKNKIHSKREK